jgi:hypothetical protein
MAVFSAPLRPMIDQAALEATPKCWEYDGKPDCQQFATVIMGCDV